MKVEKAFLFGVKKTADPAQLPALVARGVGRARQSVRVGIPKVLNIWTLAPFLRTYLETLGLQKQNVVFSDYTSEEMWHEGGKYGSIDPCYPSKVAQAHIHNLLFHHHEQEEGGKKLKYIFFPCITHVPPGLNKVMDTASCPIVAGAPEVMKAAFTKETDFFATRGINYVDPALTFTEPHAAQEPAVRGFGPAAGRHRGRERLRRATRRGRRWTCVDADLQTQGQGDPRDGRGGEPRRGADDRRARITRTRASTTACSRSSRCSATRSCRCARSRRIRTWLHRFFERTSRRGASRRRSRCTDVWPENYSANSVQKVWAAKFAARHPNVVVLDLSSFKCGHDAPTYGLIDSIISTSATPYSALHDIDANKPGGSIKIRVKTYAHSLKLHEERLEDVAQAAGRAEVPHRGEAAAAARAEAGSSSRRASSRIRRSKR